MKKIYMLSLVLLVSSFFTGYSFAALDDVRKTDGTTMPTDVEKPAQLPSSTLNNNTISKGAKKLVPATIPSTKVPKKECNIRCIKAPCPCN
ncbi:MAG: hypothetical protein Q8S31_08205 [Alphaproteobacteria bacterium]|nr:hypothetical protein [Alphaproteobacteria bacterium]